MIKSKLFVVTVAVLTGAIKFDISDATSALTSAANSGSISQLLQKLEGKVSGDTDSDSTTEVRQPVLPNLSKFDISMLKQNAITAEDLKRAVPSSDPSANIGDDDDDDDLAEDDSLVDSTATTQSVVPQTELTLLKQLIEQFQTTNSLVSDAKSALKDAKSALAEIKAAGDAREANEEQEPHGVNIKLYGGGGGMESVKSDTTKNSQDSETPLFSLASENIIVPIVYTRPDSLAEVEEVMKCANNDVLLTAEMRLAEINLMFKSGQSMQRVRDSIALLQSYTRSQKEFVESSISSLTKALLTK